MWQTGEGIVAARGILSDLRWSTRRSTNVGVVIHVLKSTYLQPPDVVEQTRPAHLELLKAEIAAGRLLLAGRQEDGSGGVLVTGDISTEEAQDLVARDPYTARGRRELRADPFNGAFRAAGL